MIHKKKHATDASEQDPGALLSTAAEIREAPDSESPTPALAYAPLRTAASRWQNSPTAVLRQLRDAFLAERYRRRREIR